jgi:protein-disulfide isomerase
MARALRFVPLMVCLLAATSAGQGKKAAPPGTAPAGTKKSALDKKTLEPYIRHRFLIDPAKVQMQIGDPVEAGIAGLYEVQVHLKWEQGAQDLTLYVSKDGQKIFHGEVFDINQNPFKRDLDKLKTEFQPSFGTPGATVVLVLFTDFQCPYCKEEAKMLRQNLPSAYPKQVRVYFKDFPLEMLHPWAKTASITGRCVFRQNPALFWDYHDWVYENQAQITAENLKSKMMDWSKGKEIDVLQLARCIDTRATEAEVDRNIAEGKSLNVVSTPTMFVNGRKLVGHLDWPSLRQIIDSEIEYQKTARNAGEDCGCEVKLPSPLGNLQ